MDFKEAFHEVINRSPIPDQLKPYLYKYRKKGIESLRIETVKRILEQYGGYKVTVSVTIELPEKTEGNG